MVQLSGCCSGDTKLVFDRCHVRISDEHTGYPEGEESSLFFFPVAPNIRDSTSNMPRTLPSSYFPTHRSRTPYRTTLLQFEIPCHKKP